MDKRRWRQWTMRALLAGGLLAAGVAGAFFFFRPPQVTVAAAAVRDITPVIQGVGTVEALRLLLAEVAGRPLEDDERENAGHEMDREHVPDPAGRSVIAEVGA